MSALLDLQFDVLISRAESRNELGALEANLVLLSYLFKTNFQFRKFIRSMGVPIEDRVREIVSLEGFQDSQTFIELMFVILSEGFSDEINQISDRFTDLVNQKTGRYLVVVVTPVTMDDATKIQVGQRLSSVFGRSVVLRNDVDETLIGGSVLKLPDETEYDFSMKRQLTEFKSYLMEKV
jgi:F-type H+-transporting ATPase subunit delta